MIVAPSVYNTLMFVFEHFNMKYDVPLCSPNIWQARLVHDEAHVRAERRPPWRTLRAERSVQARPPDHACWAHGCWDADRTEPTSLRRC